MQQLNIVCDNNNIGLRSDITAFEVQYKQELSSKDPKDGGMAGLRQGY